MKLDVNAIKEIENRVLKKRRINALYSNQAESKPKPALESRNFDGEKAKRERNQAIINR